MIDCSNLRLERGPLRRRQVTSALAKLLRRILILMGFGLVIACGMPSSQVHAQTSQPVANFRGTWHWAIYAKSRDELPLAYRGEKLKDVPAAAVDLKIVQKGNKLTGEYFASRRFLARLDEGKVDTIIKGNVARLELKSGFGGTVTVLLRLRGTRLHWRVVKSEGEFYFPDDVYLTRVVTRRNRR